MRVLVAAVVMATACGAGSVPTATPTSAAPSTSPAPSPPAEAGPGDVPGGFRLVSPLYIVDRSQLLDDMGTLVGNDQYVLAWDCFVGTPARLEFEFIRRDTGYPVGSEGEIVADSIVGRSYGVLPPTSYALRVTLLGDARCHVQLGQQSRGD